MYLHQDNNQYISVKLALKTKQSFILKAQQTPSK